MKGVLEGGLITIRGSYKGALKGAQKGVLLNEPGLIVVIVYVRRPSYHIELDNQDNFKRFS